MNDITLILKHMFTLMEAIRPQKPKFYEFLHQLMKRQGQLFTEDTVIYQPGDEVDRAFFISEGFITRSSVVGKKKVLLSIFEKDEIKAGPDFMEQQKAEFLIEATKDTYVAYITHEQMKKVYTKFPEAYELASLIISAHNRKEARMRKMLQLKGIELVEAFYLRYPLLIKAGSVLKDAMIASFLKISLTALRVFRSELLDSERLLIPGKPRKGKNGK